MKKKGEAAWKVGPTSVFFLKHLQLCKCLNIPDVEYSRRQRENLIFQSVTSATFRFNNKPRLFQYQTASFKCPSRLFSALVFVLVGRFSLRVYFSGGVVWTCFLDLWVSATLELRGTRRPFWGLLSPPHEQEKGHLTLVQTFAISAKAPFPVLSGFFFIHNPTQAPVYPQPPPPAQQPKTLPQHTHARTHSHVKM